MDDTTDRNHKLVTLQAALTTTFGLQLLRILLPSFVQFLRDAVGLESVELAPLAFGLFATSFLAAPMYNLVGGKKSFIIVVGGLTLLRLAEQLSKSVLLDFIFSAGGVILFTWFIPFAISQIRRNARDNTFHFGVGVLLGMTFDSGLHVASGTLNISWQKGILPIITVFLLSFVTLWILRAQSEDMVASFKGNRSWKATLPLIAIGPWLFLELLIFQNIARTAAATEWSLPASGALIGLGNALRIWMAGSIFRLGKNITQCTILSGLLLVVSLFFANVTGPMAAVIILIGQMSGAVLFMIIISAQGKNQAYPGIKRVAIANGFAQLLFVILAFLYYASYDIPLGFRSITVLPIAGLFLAFLSVLHTSYPKRLYPPYQIGLMPVYASALMLFFPAFLYFQWNPPSPINPPDANDTVRIMSYNVHMGFNTAGKLDIESIAQTIEGTGAEIIGFQEVSRGWLTSGSLDMLEWLSQRLEMPYVSGPTADLQWGNAILSRYPIQQFSIQSLSPDHLLIRRGYILAEIDIGENTLTFISTHLHHPENDTDIRLIQVPEILKAWGTNPRTVILGDFNATPESPEITMFQQAGLVEASSILTSSSKFTFPSNNPQRQIDYIWVSPDILPIEFNIPKTTASDHLPIVATIQLD